MLAGACQKRTAPAGREFMGKSVLLGGKAGALGGVHGAGTSGTIADTDARRGALAAFIMHAAVCTARNRHIRIWMLRVGCVLRALRLWHEGGAAGLLAAARARTRNFNIVPAAAVFRVARAFCYMAFQFCHFQNTSVVAI